MSTELWSKFAKAVAACQPVARDQVADTGTYQYRYSNLTSVLHAVKTACDEHGLVIAQPVVTNADTVRVDTLVIDRESGDVLEFPGMAGKASGNPQAVGSLITYARRYNLTSLFALEVDDDDGATARDWSGETGTTPPKTGPDNLAQAVFGAIKQVHGDERDALREWVEQDAQHPWPVTMRALMDDNQWCEALAAHLGVQT